MVSGHAHSWLCRQMGCIFLASMDSLHERAGEVFLAALARPPAERDAFLVAACKDDVELLREVASLLVFHQDGDVAEAPPSDKEGEFSAGDVFGGRYRMISRVG